MADPERPLLDLATPTDIHVVGIGGAGMSAIATVLAAMGHRVSGSDLKDSRAVERLRAQGIRVGVGHEPEHLGSAAVVAVSTAIRETNPEVVEARERGVPVLRRSEVMAALTAVTSTVSVAGTHGKTTTSSMLAMLMLEAGLEPSFIIGGDVHQVGSGAVWADGRWFVVEADESDGTFLELDTTVAMVTNIEPDHLSHYGSERELNEAFARFMAGAREAVVACSDDPLVRQLVTSLPEERAVITYGLEPGADLRLVDLVEDRDGSRFTVERAGRSLGAVELPVPGRHNALNALGALAAGLHLGASFADAAAALARFGGVARRFERRGVVDDIPLIDDYAHLPSEIAAALDAGRAGGWKTQTTRS
ncbi:MAG: UDP-N-acetylmuramate--L-alanine ligase [Actinomycetota bacterium]